jgi:hypothetical protein
MTEVEVTFTALPAESATRVDLVHRDWERLGARADFVRGLYDNGWIAVLDRFVARAAGGAEPEWVPAPGCIERS